VGSDGGLFERPVEVDEMLLATGERVELLVRGTGAPGSVRCCSRCPTTATSADAAGGLGPPRDLLTLQYTRAGAVPPPALPARLRAVPPLDTTQVRVRRVVVMTQGFINGRAMDMDRVDVAQLGATEIWEVENLVGMDHPFHLHGFQFQVLDRDGVPEPFAAGRTR
jgi:FtsP/CotA-like multicopper oxidase with cupredoxin domain